MRLFCEKCTKIFRQYEQPYKCDCGETGESLKSVNTFAFNEGCKVSTPDNNDITEVATDDINDYIEQTFIKGYAIGSRDTMIKIQEDTKTRANVQRIENKILLPGGNIWKQK